MKKILLMICIFILSNSVLAQRIKDLAYFKGSISEQVIGYGLVVGLAGSGDTYRSNFTVQTISSMLKRFGITVPETNLRTRNVASVMITATLNPHSKPGSNFDVVVSSMGDASSLQGGTLLMTPLTGMNGVVYGFAQGSISIGGYDINTYSGGRIAKNHAAAGRVPNGGILQIPISGAGSNAEEISLFLMVPDFTTANNVVQALNQKFGGENSYAVDASEIRIKIPEDKKNNVPGFMAEIESTAVERDVIAKVVLNERTGTVVAGSNVRISAVTITHGNLTLTIRSYPIIAQPGPFSQGSAVVLNNLTPFADEETGNIVAIDGAATVQDIAAALNQLKVVPRDIIAIFQALKEAGALTAELVIM